MTPGEELRSVMRHFPGGVTVVTCGPEEDAEGMTASAVISVSLDPPLMLVSVQRDARIRDKILDRKHYAINFLAEDQEGLSRLFASPERSGGLEAAHSLGGGPGKTGAPLASGAIASVECELEATYPGGDHELFLGRVVAVHPGETGKNPLVYHEGGYPRLVPADGPGEAGAFMDSARGFDARLQGFGRRRGKQRG
ncbi:flavin reductase family protein [Rubrobacter indicoceani]|uniref:flavin reductase family protein n=1 Tax=Rubrobacter indicoceani TaxID=2051957 RepID=UPI0013C3F660|nr:flavin reductase family protein [Rubrobacter indicoceani]